VEHIFIIYLLSSHGKKLNWGARCTTMDKLLDKNDSNMNLTWEKKNLVDSHDVAVHMEGDLFFIIDTQI